MMTVFIMAAGGHLRAHARLARVSQRFVERVAVRTPAEVPPIIGCRVWLLLQLLLAAAFPLFLWRSWYQSNVAR